MKSFRSARLVISLLILLLSSGLFAQISSRNGFAVPTTGTIRLLVVWAEINFIDTSLNTSPHTWWQKGQLPNMADSLLDPQWTGNPTPRFMTDYYAQMSMGQLKVLGDYLHIGGNPVILNESGFTGDLNDYDDVIEGLIDVINTNPFQTGSGLSPSDFDIWDYQSGNFGIQRSVSQDSKYDMVLFFIRNISASNSAAYLDDGLPINMYGMSSSNYLAFNHYTFSVLRHEFGHALLGNNYFHSFGGNDRGWDTESYFIATQGGWGLMNSYAGSLACANAWDRWRLGWKDSTRDSILSCTDPSTGGEKPSNLDALNISHEGTYVLKDFISTGDAMRIKLPFIPGSEFPQWLWIENHQGYTYFDNHRNVDSCQSDFQPGLYMYIQCDREDTGSFDGYADFGKPLSAHGLYDLEITSETIVETCSDGANNVTAVENIYPNPFSGYGDLQQIDFDKNNDNHIDFAYDSDNDGKPDTGERMQFELEKQMIVNPYLDSIYDTAFFYRGNARQAFHNGTGGKTRIGIGTNPSTASHMTLVSDNEVITIGQGNLQNNRTVILNGVEVEITNYNSGTGAITVNVQFDQIHVEEDTRWCADDIYLPNLAAAYASSLGAANWSLIIDTGATVTIDRNRMPTRIDDPQSIYIDGQTKKLFNDSTVFSMETGARIRVEKDSNLEYDYERVGLIIDGGSKVILGEGNELNLDYSSLEILNGSILQLDSGAFLNLTGNRGRIHIDETSFLVINKGSSIHLEGGQTNISNDGTIVLGTGATWGWTGDGFYYQGPGGIIISDASNPWVLTGRGCSDVKYELASSQTWYGSVSISSFKIEYWADDVAVRFKDGANVTVFNMCFDVEYDAINDTALVIENSTAEVSYSAFDGEFNGMVYFKDCNGIQEVSNCTGDHVIYGVVAENTDTLLVLDCDITSVGTLPSGPIYYYNTCLKVDNADRVFMDRCTFMSAAYGVYLENTDGFYMRSGEIMDSDYGLYAENSLVFLRSGASIHDCLEYGVGMFDDDPIDNMLTMGDSGCANIYSCDVGIDGTGTTLNIDAKTHADNAGTSSFIQANTINNTYWDIRMCYDNTITYPGTVWARKNFWNGTSAPTSFSVKHTPYFVSGSTSCSGGSAVSIVTTDYATTSTCSVGNGCSCVWGTNPSGNGSFDGVPNKRSLDKSENIHDLILDEFQRDNSKFMNKDVSETRSEFLDIAAIGLSNYGDSALIETPSGKIYVVDLETAHRIWVAKVLTKTPSEVQRSGVDLIAENPFVEEDGLEEEVILYPNPASQSISVILRNSDYGTIRILDQLSRVVLEQKISEGVNEMSIDHLPAGVYAVEVAGGQNVRFASKLIVQ